MFNLNIHLRGFVSLHYQESKYFTSDFGVYGKWKTRGYRLHDFLDDSLQNAISEHLEWLKFQKLEIIHILELSVYSVIIGNIIIEIIISPIVIYFF